MMPFLITYYSVGGDSMKLNGAVSNRLQELLSEKRMTQYRLFFKSRVPKSTIGSVINCDYSSVKLRIMHEMCQGLEISISGFSRRLI